jgi:hypothetical protein
LAAKGYEKYRFEKLVFRIQPKNPATFAGAVYAAVDYDWDDEPADNAQRFMANQGAVASDIWTPFSVVVDVRRLNSDLPWRYVADVPRFDDSQRMIYSGFFMIATVGTSQISTFDVFVDYRVAMILPTLPTEVAEVSAVTSNVNLSSGLRFVPVLPKMPLRVGTTGAGSVPECEGLLTGTRVMELSPISNGVMDFYFSGMQTGVTPAALQNDVRFDLIGHDEAGRVVADTLLNFGVRESPWLGPSSPAEALVNGKPASAGFTIFLDELRRRWPTIMYLAPYVTSIIGRMMTTGTTYVKWSD